MMDIVAAAVVVATFVFIIRGAEVRLALLAGGAVLALAAWKPEAWFNSFAASMVQAGLLTVILPAIGFTTVIKLAKCDQHLVRLVVGPLLSLRAVIAGTWGGAFSAARALMPVLPLFLLVLTVPKFGLTTAWFPKGLTVLHAMVAGTLVTAVVGRLSPAKVVKGFFDGMGEAYAGVIGIIIAAGVSVFDIARRNAIPAIAAAVVVVVILGFF